MKTICLLALLFLFFSGCESPMNQRIDGNEKQTLQTSSFEKQSVQAEVKWIDGPYGNIKKTNYLMVFLYKDDVLYSLPKGQTLNFYATMPSMGHPLEDPGYFEEIDEGIYANKNIRYNMPGDWTNELQIMDSDFNILDKFEWLIHF